LNGSGVGYVLGSVSLARPLCGASYHIRAGEAAERLPDRHRAFLRWRRVFIAAEVQKLTVVERLFQLNKKKLLSIPLFVWGSGTGGE